MTKWLSFAIALVGVTAAVWFGRQANQQTLALKSSEESWKRREAELLSRIRTLESAPVTADPVEAPPIAPAPPRTKVVKVTEEDPVTRQQLIRQVNERSEKLAAAETAFAELQNRFRDAESQIAALHEEAQRLAASEKSLQERLDAAAKLADTLQAESKSRETQFASVEATSLDLKRRTNESAQKAARLSKLADEMDDLARRQDSYLYGILRRYREVADLYRTFALRRESSREDPLQSNNDVSRIQNAIALADEDLRQLRTLQAQGARLQKELSAAKK